MRDRLEEFGILVRFEQSLDSGAQRGILVTRPVEERPARGRIIDVERVEEDLALA
ncbi:MAG: hypothetical protein ACI8UO_005767 [Verrucomicrobiales bacterium]|jgi:hypothetical protein